MELPLELPRMELSKAEPRMRLLLVKLPLLLLEPQLARRGRYTLSMLCY